AILAPFITNGTALNFTTRVSAQHSFAPLAATTLFGRWRIPMSVVNEWAFIGVFMSIAWVFPSLPLVLSWVFRPRKANAIKLQTYECGVETVGDTWVQFKVQ